MIIFHPIKCKCSCHKIFIANIAGADYDRVNLLGGIDCPDCQEKKIKIAERKEDGNKR